MAAERTTSAYTIMHLPSSLTSLALLSLLPAILAVPTHESSLHIDAAASTTTNMTVQYQKCDKGGIYCFSEIANMGTSSSTASPPLP